MTIAQFTLFKRTQAGISQQAVADELGLNQSQIHRRETGEAGWRWAEIVLLARLLKMDLAAFVAEFQKEQL